jgi:hypothetical protein
VCMLYQEAVARLACHSEALSEPVRLDLEVWPTLVMAYLETPAAAEAGTALVQHLLQPAWDLPLTAEDAELLKALLAEPATTPPQAEAAAVSQHPEEASNEAVVTRDLEDTAATAVEEAAGVELGKTAQGLIDLLIAEVTQIAETLAQALPSSAAGDWRQVLSEDAEDLERLGGGAESLGLQGLHQVCGHIRTNLLRLTSQEQPLSESQCQLIAAWPELVLAYLQGFHELHRRTALSQYLCDTRWPQPLSQEDGTALSDTLQVTRLNWTACCRSCRDRQRSFQPPYSVSTVAMAAWRTLTWPSGSPIP